MNGYLHRIQIRAVYTGFVLCVLVGVGGAARAQKPSANPALPAVFLKPYAAEASGLSFTDLTAKFSQATGISIVADGEPLLAKANLKFDGTARQALDRIADTYDFDWTVTKSGIVLMTKRFTSLKDSPQFSLPETRQIIKDMSKALQTVTFRLDADATNTLLQGVYDTLSPAQAQALRAGQEIPAAQLLPGAFDMMKESILCNMFGRPLSHWNRLSDDLDVLPTSFLQAKERRYAGSNPPHFYEVMWNHYTRNGGLSYGSFAIIPIVDKNVDGSNGQGKTEGQP